MSLIAKPIFDVVRDVLLLALQELNAICFENRDLANSLSACFKLVIFIIVIAIAVV